MNKSNILLLLFILPFLTHCIDTGVKNKKYTNGNKQNASDPKTTVGGGSTPDPVTPTTPTAPTVPTNPTTPIPPVVNEEILKELKGAYIPSAYAAGCTPGVFSDFMETILWVRRKVEPRDCAIVTTANPIFSWVIANDINVSVPMTFTLTNLSTNISNTISVTNRGRLIYPSALANGNYQWTVKYTTTKNAVVISQPRRFTLQSNGLKIPTGTEFTAIVNAKSRPRALPSGSTFSAISTRALNGEYKPAYQSFLNRANIILNNAITPVPENFTRSNFSSDVEYNNWMIALKNAASTEKSAIEYLGYAFYFTNNAAYQANAITRLLALADWPVDGATSEATQDQANREIYLALGIGLDLFQAKLTSNQRASIVSTLKNRLSQVMSKYPGLDKNPYDSHLLTAIQYTTETLMYALGTPEFPEAGSLLATSWDVMITNTGSWGGYDGAYGQGGAYGWYSMTTIARTLAAVKLVSNVDLSKWPPFGNFGYNQIAFYPANAKLMGQFGDDVENNHHYSDYAYDSMRLLASTTANPDYEWYWRANPASVTYAGPLNAFHYLMLGTRPNNPSAPSSVNLPKSFLFEDAGLVAMHSNTTEGLRSSVFFRSSRLGSFNHSHADNNAFTFVSKGKEIFISGGYYPYYNSPHHALVNRATRFKNALTFDGGIGQMEPTFAPTAPGNPVIYTMEGRGKLLNFEDNGVWSVATGDASLAYRGYNGSSGASGPQLLNNAIRSIAYNRKNGIIIIYDWATSDTVRTWELNFQTLNAVTQSTGGSLGITTKVINGTSQACMNIITPATGSYKFTNGFPILPEITQPTQSQTRFSVTAPSKEFVAVTVIREDCKDLPVSVNFTGHSAKISVDGKTIIANGKSLQY